MAACRRRIEIVAFVLAVLVLTFAGQAQEQEMDLSYRIEAAKNSGGQGKVVETLHEATTEELVQVVHDLITGQWGNDFAMLRKLVLTELRARPEHAKFVGDRIDQRTNQRGSEPFLVHDFRILEFIGSAEALEQIGRFMWDERVPEPKGFRDPDVGFSTTPLKTRAAWELCVFLGGRSPVQANALEFYNGGVEKMQQWYKENESKLKAWERPVESGLGQFPRPPHGNVGDMRSSDVGTKWSDKETRTQWMKWIIAVILGIGVLLVGVRWSRMAGR